MKNYYKHILLAFNSDTQNLSIMHHYTNMSRQKKTGYTFIKFSRFVIKDLN